jgi:ABC-type oligopeptide transport system substrate-binding subunit
VNEAAAALQMWLAAMPQYPITISVMDAATLQRKATAHQLQFWASSWVADYPDPHDWLTTNLACGASHNAGQVCDEQADSLMLSADVIPAQSARMEMYREAEQMLVADVAWLPLDQTTRWWEAKPWIQNFSIASDGLIPKETWQTMQSFYKPSNPVDRIP